MQRLREMADVITTTGQRLDQIASTSQDIRIKAGLAAEAAHKHGFNAHAIAQGSEARAYTDHDEEFYEFGLRKNGPIDIVMAEPARIAPAQVKYHGTPDSTAAALREPDTSGQPKYRGQQLVVASDQADAVEAAARRTRLKEEGSGRRPQVAAAAGMVEESVSDRLRLGTVHSTPISLHESKQLVVDPHGPTRRAIEEPHVKRVVADVITEAQRTGQSFDPHNPFSGDPWDRLVKNGTVVCTPENADADGNFPIEYVWYSTDPEHSLEDLEARERTHDSIATVAVHVHANSAAPQLQPFLDEPNTDDDRKPA